MLMKIFICLLLVGTSFQWAFNPADFSPSGYAYTEKRPARPIDEDVAPVGYIANPFVSPLARKWRKLRSRRDYSNVL